MASRSPVVGGVLSRSLAGGLSPGELTALVAPVSRASAQCEGIARLLTVPKGGPLVLEGVHRLLLRALHAPGVVELVVLLPKGNGKTTVMALATIVHLLTTPNAQAFIGAAEKEQADEMYAFTAHFASCDPEIEAALLVRDGTRQLRRRVDRGYARVLASDKTRAGGTKQGFNPSLFLCDELHAHLNRSLYDAGVSGVQKAHPLGSAKMGTISTAGHDPQSPLGERRAQLRRDCQASGVFVEGLHVTDDGGLCDEGPGRLTVAVSESGRTVLLEWACRGEDHPAGADDLTDDATVKLASPASFVTVESLRSARESLEPWTFARYRANVWTLGHKSWLPAGAWTAAVRPGVELSASDPTALFVDMGRYSDSAAVVAVQTPAEGPRVTRALLIEESGGPDRPVDYELVKAAVRDACVALEVVAVGYDPKYFDQAAQELADENVPMELWPQSNERMGRAVPRLRRAIIASSGRDNGERAVVHAGDDHRFDRQVVAGRTKDLGEDAFKIVKPSEVVHIDAGVALAGAHELAVLETGTGSRARIEVWA